MIAEQIFGLFRKSVAKFCLVTYAKSHEDRLIVLLGLLGVHVIESAIQRVVHFAGASQPLVFRFASGDTKQSHELHLLVLANRPPEELVFPVRPAGDIENPVRPLATVHNQRMPVVGKCRFRWLCVAGILPAIRGRDALDTIEQYAAPVRTNIKTKRMFFVAL